MTDIETIKHLLIGTLENVESELLDFSSDYWHYFKDGSAYMTADDIQEFCINCIENKIKILKGDK